MPYPPSPRTCHTGVLEATMSELLSTPTMSTLASSASSVRAPRGSGGKRRVSCHAAGAGAARPSRPSSCGLGRRSVVGMRGTEKTVGAREPARRPNHTPPPRQHSPRGRLDPYPPTFSRVHYHTLPGKNPEPCVRGVARFLVLRTSGCSVSALARCAAAPDRSLCGSVPLPIPLPLRNAPCAAPCRSVPS